jgi:hypothetical protein
MNIQTHHLPRLVAAGLLGLTASALVVPCASPASAQADRMSGIGLRDTVTTRATVKDIDQATRTVTLVNQQGETTTLKVGDQVRNLAQVKVGDTVVARYYASIAFVLAPPGTKLPDDSLTVAGGRARPGSLPAGVVGTKAIVTGLVVGVDPLAHTLSLVDPSGGRVRTLHVTDPRALRALTRIKVGDTITAVASEAVAVAVDPA